MQLNNFLEIFNNKCFRIPDYQRGYSWDKLQLIDLWRDISVLEDDQIHYTGMLSVKKYDDQYFVIDGQQRITTLVIFIKVICAYFKNSNKTWVNGREVKDYIKTFLYKKTGSHGQNIEMIFGYERDNPSHIYFKTHILNIENTDDSTPENTLYTKKLSEAKKFLEKKIENLDFSTVERLLKIITQNLKFNFYQIEDELNEFVAFETMNNRGKPLSTLELLKNRLIYLSTLIKNYEESEKNQLREDINNAWKTIYEYLGKNPTKVIKDDNFLKDHWIMNFTYDRAKSNVYKSFLLNEHFTRERIIKESTNNSPYDEIRDYVINIQKSVKHYYYIHNPSDSNYNNDIKRWLGKLNRLSGFEIFKPLLTVLFVKEIDDKHIIQFLKYAEKFAFVAYSLNHSQANYKNSYFYGLAKKVNKNKIYIYQILDDDNFHKLELNLQDFISKITKIKHEFYKWKGVKYFLYEYELYLKEGFSGELKIEWERINKDSIEHIFPQNSKDECWNHFGSHDLVHDIGNLLLLSIVDNSTLGNKCFNRKKEYFSNNSFSAIEVSKSENWNQDTIIDRRNKLFTFMAERWRINVNITEINNVLSTLPKDRHEPENLKIGQLVHSKMDLIVNYCRNNPEELSMLQDKEYSKTTFNLNFAFFKKNDEPNKKMYKYYKDQYVINDDHFGLTTEWFDHSKRLFVDYINSHIKQITT